MGVRITLKIYTRASAGLPEAEKMSIRFIFTTDCKVRTVLCINGIPVSVLIRVIYACTYTNHAKKSAAYLPIKNREIMRPEWKNLPTMTICAKKSVQNQKTLPAHFICYLCTYTYMLCKKKRESSSNQKSWNYAIKMKKSTHYVIFAKKKRIIIYVHMPTQTRGSAWWHFWQYILHTYCITTLHSNWNWNFFVPYYWMTSRSQHQVCALPKLKPSVVKPKAKTFCCYAHAYTCNNLSSARAGCAMWLASTHGDHVKEHLIVYSHN